MSTIVPAALATVFGPAIAKGIGSIVEKFDFSKMDVNDSTRDDYLHCGVAPSYDDLTAESIKAMDKELKVMIAGTMHAIEKIPSDERSWERVLGTMMQNTLLEADVEGIVDRTDRILKDDTAWFKFDGSPDAAIVKEVEGWFIRLLADEDVQRATKININVLANIVAWTGASVDAIEAILYKKEVHEKRVVDVGVLRFPSISQPYFKLYHIKLNAWSQSKRVLALEHNINGITGEFSSRNFRPNKEVIAKIKPELLIKAVDEAEDLLK